MPRDLARETAELALARERLPNDPQVFWLSGMIANSAGNWDECSRSLERSVVLDPRNSSPLYDLIALYAGLRRYDDERRIIARSLTLHKDPFFWQDQLAGTFLDERADPQPRLALFAPVPPGKEAFADATLDRFNALCMDARFCRGRGACSTARPPRISPTTTTSTSRARGSRGGSPATRETKAPPGRLSPAPAPPCWPPRPLETADFTTLDLYARIDAVLGRKTEALGEARRAYEIESKNGYWGPRTLLTLALVETWTGETDAALGHLAELARLPYGPSYGNLRLNRDWDALRGDARFEALCRELAPGK